MRVKELIITFTVIIFCGCVTTRASYDVNRFKNSAADSTNIGQRFVDTFEYEKAIEHYRESLKFNILADNIPGMIKNFVDFAKVYILMADYTKAEDYIQRGFNLSNQEPSYQVERGLLFSIYGDLEFNRQNYDTALQHYEEAIRIFEHEKKPERLANALIGKAKIALKNNRTDEALAELLTARTILEDLYSKLVIRNLSTLSSVYYSIGNIYFRSERYSESLENLQKAMEIDKTIENSGAIADDYFALAFVYKRLGDEVKYYDYMVRSRYIYGAINTTVKYIETTRYIADYLKENNRLKEYYDELFKLQAIVPAAQKPALVQEIKDLFQRSDINEYFSATEVTGILNYFRTNP